MEPIKTDLATCRHDRPEIVCPLCTYRDDLPEPDYTAMIDRLMREGAEFRAMGDPACLVLAHRYEAAAALLDVHTMTGINLGTFGPVGDFVTDVLDSLDLPGWVNNGV